MVFKDFMFKRKHLFHRKFRLPKFENCGLRNRKHPLTVPYCESRTTGTENSYTTTIFQTLVTGIFGEIDTLLKMSVLLVNLW